MASVREQIVAAAAATLAAALPTHPVMRSRLVPAERWEGVAVSVSPESEATAPNTNSTLRELRLAVRVVARGTPPDAAADETVVAVHAAMLADPTLGIAGCNVVEESTDWQMTDADGEACVVTVTYLARYLTALDAL